MEQDLRSMRQEDRTVAEYEREFSRLLHCVPFVVRDDEDKARIFERGLRPSIFRLVQSSQPPDLPRCGKPRAHCGERRGGSAGAREGLDKGNGKRPSTEGASQEHSGRRPRHPRSRSQSQDVAHLPSMKDRTVDRLRAA
uniref:Retrotransposon gag domain-containing protein n=1 Tax=Ananas comosus var. bracteatus TaxID=296719 RepID=A0A6V7NT46_ANACO|nr:unnamed protein product [Ananas comosus var. bracteatus]